MRYSLGAQDARPEVWKKRSGITGHAVDGIDMSRRSSTLEGARNARLRSDRERQEYIRLYIHATVSALLVEMRVRARLSQKQVARRSKLRLPTLQALESADESVEPTFADVVRVAAACGFDFSALISKRSSRADATAYPMNPGGL